MTVIDVVDFLHCPMNNLVDDDALRICYVFISQYPKQPLLFISQYPKQPLQHGRDEDEGSTPSHHTAAGIKSHNSCFLFAKPFLLILVEHLK